MDICAFGNTMRAHITTVEGSQDALPLLCNHSRSKVLF